MCESGLRTKRCELSRLRAAFFVSEIQYPQNDLSISGNLNFHCSFLCPASFAMASIAGIILRTVFQN